jgi:methylmalonyl-CoA mutase, N-terminal domain
VRARRSPEAVDAALAQVRANASDVNTNVMPALLGAVNAYATVGEIVDALADVFGRWREDPRL